MGMPKIAPRRSIVVRWVSSIGPGLFALALLAACSDSTNDSSATTVIAAPATTRVRTAADPPDPCTLLTAADFAAADVVLEAPGVDLSGSLTLATSSSAACHWEGSESGIGGNWELLIGRGHAAEAYEFDRGFAALDGIETLDLGDAGFLADRVDSATPEDYDFEVGVLIGDLYFSLSSTADEGGEAIRELAAAVAERIASSG